MLKILAFVSALLVASGCSLGGDCDLSFRYGLIVQLVDHATRAPVCDATVTATDGAHHETLQPPFGIEDAGMDCIFEGAGERAGTYTIEVRAAGYALKTVGDVDVDHSGCHVVTRSLTIEL